MKHIITAGIVALSLCSETARATQGYFWYEEKPAEEKTASDISQYQKQKPRTYSQEQMMQMHPAFLKEILQDHHEYAIQTLKPEDYTDYLITLDVVRKKSASAASLQAASILSHPELNPNAQHPVTNAAIKTRKAVNERRIISRLQKESSNYALGFFVSKTCSYCKDQVPSLRRFQEKTGWNVSEVDIDDRPDLAERFDARVTPMLILMKRNSNTWRPVAVGVESLPKIEQNAYKTIRLLEGEISPHEFNTLETQDGGFFDTGNQL